MIKGNKIKVMESLDDGHEKSFLSKLPLVASEKQ